MHLRSVISVVITLFAVSLVWTACSKTSEEELASGSPVTPACDTVNMKYAANIQPILSAASCTGCHSTAAKQGGIVLDTYTALKAQVTNGKLIGSITHASGYVAMPLGGTKLSDCNINKIKGWIARGAQNN